MRFLTLLVVLCVAAQANAQTVVKSVITHVNGVPLQNPIVEFDYTANPSIMIARPPLLQYQERILIRGQPVGVTLQTQRPFVQFEVGKPDCPDGNCPLPQQGLFRRR